MCNKKIFERAISFLKEKDRYIFFFFVLVSLFFFSLWLLAFYPAIMTADSIGSWEQILKNSFSNWHPYVFTFYIKFLKIFYNSPASIGFFQLIVSSFLGSYIFYFLFNESRKKWTVIFSFFLFIFSVPIGLYNITIWKDIIFAHLVVMWGFIFFFLIKNKINNLSNSYLIILSLLLFFTSTVRHNGIIFLFLIPILFFLNKLLSRSKSIIFFLLTISLYLVSVKIIPDYLKIDMYKRPLEASTKINIISSILSSNYYYYDSNKSEFPLWEIEKLISIKEIKENYLCQNINPIFFNKNFYAEVLKNDEYYYKFNKISDELILRNLPIAIGNRICISASTLMGEGVLYYNILDESNYDPKIGENLGIKQNIKTKNLNNFLMKVVSLTTRYPYHLIFWNLLIPMMLYFFSIIYFFKRDKAIFNYSLVLLIQVPFVLATIGANDFRYLYFIYFGFFFLIPMFFLKRRK